MPSHGKIISSVLSPRVGLVALALAIGGLVFAPFYLMTALYPWLPHSFRVVPAWFQALTLFNLARSLLLTNLTSYLVFSCLGIVTAAEAVNRFASGDLNRAARY